MSNHCSRRGFLQRTALVFGASLVGGEELSAAVPSGGAFPCEETTIAAIHAALKSRRVTCRGLVQAYLDRIAAYDKQGPAINSLITINSQALARATELDRDFARHRRWAGPLHGIPFIVKDNFNTAGLETTAGCLALKGTIPPRDAFQVEKIRAAGGIVLAKANLSEFAFSGEETVCSRLAGYTRNPYALDRTTAGSSGGTAAAIAANFGAVGLGSDTQNSIRGPASHQSLVGLRSTMGLTSRAGIVPLDPDRDIGGPMARTVADAVAVLDVIAGPDPDDPVTAASREKLPPGGYSQFLNREGLQGGRIGVLRYLLGPAADPEVVRLYDRAVAEIQRQGATVIDPLEIPELSGKAAASSFYRRGERIVWTRCSPFKFQVNAYLAALGPAAPVHSVEEIVRSRKYHPSIAFLLLPAAQVPRPPHEDPFCEPVRQEMRQMRALLANLFARHRLDAVVYPSWSNPPRLLGNLNTTPSGMNSGRFAPVAGYPAITVPMGYAHGSLPAGLEFLGLPWSEPTLIKFCYAYEQATRHRHSPATTPSLRRAPA